MLKNICLAILCLFSVQSFAFGTGTFQQVKGFREWKNEKIQTVQNQTLNLRNQILKSNLEGNKKNSEALERQLSQVQFNLEVVRDLSVTDYFVLYLSKQSQADRFQQAAQKMTTHEVAELMEAYADTLSNSAPSEAAAQQALVQPAIVQRLPVQALETGHQFK